ncbi:cytochrome c biogenesis heme-transporting ATPase CcmA [Variovorax sp.]|uniref:cytochrome c biogenesis heme-transporting ATPase CcmA n=1 Tax=Variovorax sp. TaxID=1871043 RepID=UPI002D670E05|nr:cytochrome c biogenesis heme-transporting ATPase CcmA [Variovorax sp.]HYP83111.1 cytochrome c biogenesis heme-transporting ATPase CcmA [Variovorax sp.]
MAIAAAVPSEAADTCLGAHAMGVSRGGRMLLASVDFELRAGELLQLHGPNGSGKSSLLRVLCGLLPPASGEVRWNAQPVRAGDPHFLPTVAYLGHSDGIDADLSAAENLRFAAQLAGKTAHDAQIDACLDALGMGWAAHSPVRALSQGQRRRVALARLALLPCALWLLDEPLSGLDEEAAARFDILLQAHLRRGGMAVVATHQPLSPPGRILRLDA